jgi:hypothetical protein
LAGLPITDLNVDDVAFALDALGELPLDTINVGLRWFVPEETGSAYETVMKETFGAAGASWKGFEFYGADFAVTKGRQLTQLVKLLKTLRRRRFLDSARGRPWVSFVPDVPAENVPDYFADAGKTFGHDLCPVAWYFAQVEPDGRVCFCGDFPDYFIGNVRKTTFQEIWTGEPARLFREKLAREPLPICSRCCGNWVYGAWRRPPASGRSASAPSDALPSIQNRWKLNHWVGCARTISYSKNRRRARRRASRSGTPSARRKFSRMPSSVSRMKVTARVFPRSEMPCRIGSGSQRAP